MSQHERTNRVSELDGVRGLAILMVLFFHILNRADNLTDSDLLHTITSPPHIGWVGVDIFFVLSGFLITPILLSTKGEPDYFKNFYIRRILRIFPLYYIVIISLLVCLPTLDQDHGTRTQAAWPLFILYQQGWFYIITHQEPSAFLGVTWSLAIEEQFYLIWPAVVKFLSKRQLVIVSVAIVLFSLITRAVLISMPFDSFAIKQIIYFGSVTRFEGLAAGTLMAIAFQSIERKNRLSKYAWSGFILSVLGFGATLFKSPSFPLYNDNLTLWGYTLLVPQQVKDVG